MVDPADFPDFSATLSLWRSAAGAAPARVSGGIAGLLVPAVQFSGAPLAPAPDLGGGRYDAAFIYSGTAVREGDELRRTQSGGTTIYRVQKADRWGADSVAWVELAK